MKLIDAANENELERQIARTRRLCQSRLRCKLTDESARRILKNATGFFEVLAEWSRAERLVDVQDQMATSTSNNGGVCHDL